MIGRKVDHDFYAGGVSSADHRVEVGPGVAAVAEVFLDAFEIAALVTVIRRGRIAAAIRNVRVEIVDRGRDPNRGDAHARQVRHLLLNALQVAAPIKTPVVFGGVVQTGALRWVVVSAVAVKETIGNYLIDHFALEIGRGGATNRIEKQRKTKQERRELAGESSHD